MPIDFAYVQARAQARHGMRMNPAEWRALESSRGLAQYLHAARHTTLALLVQHFSADSSPHAIERSLRRDWQAEVDIATRWVPKSWRASVAFTAWLPYLPAIGHLMNGGQARLWMRDDPVLSRLLPDKHVAVAAAPDWIAQGYSRRGGDTSDLLDAWRESWQALWPEASSLPEIVDLIRRHLDAMRKGGSEPGVRRNLYAGLGNSVVKIMRTHLRQPVTVYCHLLLAALDYRRLRSGLMRRAVSIDVRPGT